MRLTTQMAKQKGKTNPKRRETEARTKKAKTFEGFGDSRRRVKTLRCRDLVRQIRGGKGGFDIVWFGASK